MKKRTLARDIKKCFAKSKGRFISIVCLIALGSFALVGLQVAGPDMRYTGENYFNKYKLADISIIGDYGIDENDQKEINKASGASSIEYGYLKDVVISDTNDSIRIFSATDDISQYETVSGEMPKSDDEIAIASYYADDYKIGDTIKFDEKEDVEGNYTLKTHSFKISGFVNSSELLSIINIGQSTAGTGELQGYAVVNKNVFDSDFYMIARLSFYDTEGVDPYSSVYTNVIQKHKDELDSLLKNQPGIRLNTIKTEYQQKIDDANSEISDAKTELDNAYTELTDNENKLNDAKKEYSDGLSEYESKKKEADDKLASAHTQLANAKDEIENGETQLAQKQEELSQAEQSLAEARYTLDSGWEEYNSKKAQLDSAKNELANSKAQLDASQSELDSKTVELETAMGMPLEQIEEMLHILQEQQPQLYEQVNSLLQAKAKLEAKWSEYNLAGEQIEESSQQLSLAKSQLDSGEYEYSINEQAYNSAAEQINSAKAQLNSAKQEYSDGLEEYNTQKADADKQLSEAKGKLDDAEKEISENEDKLSDGWKEYNDKKPDAESDIQEADEKVSDAQDYLNNLALPAYNIDTRREIPGAEGYKIYGSVSNIVDSLADVFPIFLYFVAALVTLTTMTRFVDEERINSGTLKALGYDNRDIVKKFVVYGLIASSVGSLIGIAAGHTLLPMIVYNAYGKSFTYPQIELHFYPLITVIAIILGLLCAVLPAFIVANKELKEKPSALLQPKAPQAGSKIFLERITPLWNRMSFTHKVTARNIFRYKKRMLMTIFGVCGAVTLIFAGFSVQHSISGLKDRQFGELMQYDLIVAKNDGITDKQQSEIDSLLSSDDIKSEMNIRYESLSKTAGANADRQEIKLIVPSNSDELETYIKLVDRNSKAKESLDYNGCIISERLAKLLNVGKGDSFTVTDSSNTEHEVVVFDITEMYMGHFMFMNSNYYEKVFGESYSTNANLITLNDRSLDNANLQASKFIELDGVKGVVQNTTLINQVNTIVQSLNKIMEILIFVAILLAVVILYNLTNINVSERIRELSTIKVLGFYSNEVTMYIYRETIILTLLGIIAGFVFGDALFLYIITVVPPDDVMFNPALGLKAFIIPTLVISLITIILGLIINRRLKNVDMLEALKSVE